MKLVIVESPSKAKTIEKYLGKGYSVIASVGHVRDLPKSSKKALDIEKGFIPHYVISKGKEEVVETIQKKAKSAEEVILATDPDREGEAIAWHIMEAAKLPKSKTKRVTFNEITKDAVLAAMAKPRSVDLDLKEAQEARRVLDRLVGYDLSGLIWKKVRYGLSAGRVQSPALRILAEREREIQAFKPVTYWTLEAALKANKVAFSATCSTEPTERGLVDKILEYGNAHDWFVKDITETSAERKPKPPFRTSTLQQAASSRLGFSPARTMRTAQKLYEKGLITYMRTDSTNLSAQALSATTAVITQEFGADLVEKRTYKTDSKNAQEAHEAVRPSDISKVKAGHTDDEKALYELIRARTLASQMKSAKIMRSKLLAQAGDGKTIPDFTVNGSRTLSPGWLLADPRARGEDTELPAVEKGQALTLSKLTDTEKQTTPPNRYSEAGLVKELEKRGIGRPSTYASIIQTLYDRQYVDRESRSLKPTDVGMVVSGWLEEHFAKYISDSFTSEMENELDDIAEGKRTYKKTLTDFYKPFHKEVESKNDTEKITDLGPAPKEFTCPICQSKMVYKLGRGGTFMSCSRFPECTGARTGEGEIIEPDKPIGTDPETGLDIFVLAGPYGPYVQLGEKTDENKKPKRASLPKDKNPEEVSIKDALKYLSLPRKLGEHPETGKTISANVGRFGPYIVHDGDFRSLKTDDVYTIELPRALEILSEPKPERRRGKKKSS